MEALWTDFVLLRCVTPESRKLAEEALAWCTQAGFTLHRLARQPDTGITFLYGRLPQRAALTARTGERLAAHWREAVPQSRDVRVSRLERVFDAPGRSHGERAAFHYVVQMDPQAGWQDEISRWYDEEHMPGLAGVPGTVHAMRLLDSDHGPLSLACYDLVTEDTLGSLPWLAVRGTAWSDKVRPKFTNTRRTMMEVLA
ncbi:MAG TPA: hypothetical protein VF522_07925 [Ramlibacter sp.]|uniref:hypothetical protein n=1 Tax=Ramlibacter sp. TaxID=1917967 RepID=UPI002ED5895F